MKIELSTPIKHRGEFVQELNIPLEELTGSDLIAVEGEMNRAGEFTIMYDYSKSYLLRIAARAAKIPIEVLRGMSARDFTQVTSKVSIFLMGSGSEDADKLTDAQAATQETDPETSSDA